jgi:hypothetical protein
MSRNAQKVLYFTRHCMYTPQSLPTPLKPIDGQRISSTLSRLNGRWWEEKLSTKLESGR